MTFSGRLALRISLILGGALTLVGSGAIVTLLYLHGGGHGTKPVVEQLVAATELVETCSPQQLALMLRALNSMDQRVMVTDRPPAETGIGMPGVSLGMERYFASIGQSRSVYVESYTAPGGIPSLRVVVGLHDGRSLVAERSDGLVGYLIGLRMVVGCLATIILVGGLAVWLLHSQLRPLESVVRAVETFGDRLDNDPLPPLRGASEIRRLVDAFNAMQQRIRRLVDGRTRMVAAIGHDLGTYLTRLRLRVEFIEDAGQRARAVRDIEEMDALMRDTLTLARVEVNAEVEQDVDLGKLAAGQVDSFASAGAEVRLVESESAVIRGQPAALGRVLGNLIGNALRYAGTAEVRVRRADDGGTV
jgi:signal transduction histidine kinase